MSLQTATFSLFDALRFAINQEVRKELVDTELNDLHAVFISGLYVTVCGPFPEQC